MAPVRAPQPRAHAHITCARVCTPIDTRACTCVCGGTHNTGARVKSESLAPLVIPVDGIPPLTSGRPPLSEERQSFWNGGAMRSSLHSVLSSPPCTALSTAHAFHPRQPGLLRQGLRARDRSRARRSFPVKGARGPFGPGSLSSRLDGCFLRGSGSYPWSHQLSPFLGSGAGVLPSMAPGSRSASALAPEASSCPGHPQDLLPGATLVWSLSRARCPFVHTSR